MTLAQFSSGPGPPAARRLLPLAAVYLPVPVVGTVVSLRVGVAASPGGDPTRDALLRGTAATPPLVIVAALILGAALARRPGRTGTLGTLAVGLVGLAFLAGSTFNLPNDLKAARAADLPVGVTYGFAAYTIAFSGVLLRRVVAALGERQHRSAS